MLNLLFFVFFIYKLVKDERARKRERERRGTMFLPLESVDNCVKREKIEEYLSVRHAFSLLHRMPHLTLKRWCKLILQHQELWSSAKSRSPCSSNRSIDLFLRVEEKHINAAPRTSKSISWILMNFEREKTFSLLDAADSRHRYSHDSV